MTVLPEWMIRWPDGLTVEDYEALPEGICRQIEVVDGGIVVRPSPGRSHQKVVHALTAALRAAAAPHHRAVSDLDLRMLDVPLLNRRPDIAVFDASLPDCVVLRPHHCLLVVEVMSPGSVTFDQVDKPAEYAHAGIEHYWRIERCDDVHKLTVFRYMLNPMTRTYAVMGASTGQLVTSEPLAVSVNFAEELL